ncbi:hypothetical protein GEMRC1_005013 [Eukaryota sp. GEM-RC1]
MGTESFPTQTFTFPPSTITEKLCNLRKEGVLIDSSISFHDDEFPCHSAVVSLFSDLLKTKLFSSSKVDDLDPIFPLLPDSSLLFKVLDSFYGISVSFPSSDLYSLGVLVSYLKYTPLSDFLHSLVQSGMNFRETFTFQLDHDVIVSNFRKFAPSDVSITYKEVNIQTNSLILVATSATFLNQFSTSFIDSNDRKITYESEFEGVEEDIFEQFFNLFYSDSIKLDISNVLSFYQLSFYFQVQELLEACKTFLLTNTFTDSELLTLLNLANVRHQVRFVEEILNVFKNLSQPLKLDSLPLSVEILQRLFPIVDNWWLIQCLLETFENQELTSEELNSILILIDIHQFDYNNLYTLIQPLFDEKSFESVLLQWSVDNFSNIKQLEKIPPHWFLWTFQAADRAKSNLEYFVANFMKVVPFEFLHTFQGFSPSPLAFKLLSPSVTADYSTFLAKSLVDSWRNFDWDVDQKKTLDDLVQNLNNDKSELEKTVTTLKQSNSQYKKFVLSSVPFPFTFTNAGKTGRNGPSLEDCIGAYNHEYFKNIQNFNVIDGIQHWTVSLTGMYRIECAGARGGNNGYTTSTKPGKGAVMIGEFELKSAQIIKILVGQVGCDGQNTGDSRAGGGGGGSFVVLDSSPLIVAGGGNGQNNCSWNTNGPDGRVDFTEGVGKGERGSGGGGFTLDGQNATSGDSTGGKSFLNGGMGGQSDTSYSKTAHGGFGGGGGTKWEGGGGGGYTGGSVVHTQQYNSTYPSYGAGSFNSGLKPVNTSGGNDGDGFVKIQLL